MTDTDQTTATADIRRRQREVVSATIRNAEAAGRRGVTLRDLRQALADAGLPAPDDNVDMERLMNGDQDPELQVLMLDALLEICREAPGFSDGAMTIGEAIEALGMTPAEAEALCQKRVAEQLGGKAH